MIPTRIDRLLRSLPVERLVDMFCELNRWQWPAEIIDIKPEHYPERADRIDTTLGWALMQRIFYLIADKMISRQWNNNMEEHEFNRQYTRNFEPI